MRDLVLLAISVVWAGADGTEGRRLYATLRVVSGRQSYARRLLRRLLGEDDVDGFIPLGGFVEHVAHGSLETPQPQRNPLMLGPGR